MLLNPNLLQCHELKSSQKEIEKLKYDNTGLDSKLKWHSSKLKIESEAREMADKKIEELSAEINQLKLKEINRAKENVEMERNMLAGKFVKSIFFWHRLTKQDIDPQKSKWSNKMQV